MKIYFKYFGILIWLAILTFELVPVASFAETRNVYHPPKGKVRHQVRKAGGSRGCPLPLDNTVTLLVPQDHTATTASSHPVFFWYLSRQLDFPLRFTLLEPGEEPILTKELTPKPGIVALKLPESSAALEIGKTYRWTVTIVCNFKRPSKNLFAQAWIERVDLPELIPKSENMPNISSCSIEYATAGIWYDALACNYSRPNGNKDNADLDLSEFWSLLEEINLPTLARQKPKLNLY